MFLSLSFLNGNQLERRKETTPRQMEQQKWGNQRLPSLPAALIFHLPTSLYLFIIQTRKKNKETSVFLFVYPLERLLYRIAASVFGYAH